MVSPNSSTDDASCGSMEDNEKRFYNKTAPVRHAPPSTSASASESDSESESENGNPVLSSPQKKPQPKPTSRNVAASVTQKPSSSAKRPREEEQSVSLEKSKKAKEVKKTTPLETPKTSEEKSKKAKEVKKTTPLETPKTSEEKSKRAKEVKKTTPLETPKTSEKTPSEEEKSTKISDSPTKSSKKNGHLWNIHDEIEFLKGVVAYQVSKGLPKTNMTPVYDYIRNLNLLEHEYSSSQMYDKLRGLKIKFARLKDKMNVGDFIFKTPHDEAIYKLGKRLWGGEEEEEEEEEESSDEEDEKNGDQRAEESQDVEMAQENEGEEEEEEDEDEVVVTEGNLASNGALKQVKQSNGKETNLAMVNEIKHDLAVEKEKIMKDIKEIVREALRSSVSTGTCDSVQFSGEEMLKRISSSREIPKLEKAEADRFELKWKKQHFIELDASSKRLQLLQEECQVRMEKLGPLVKEDNP